jgi:hypothetical protein
MSLLRPYSALIQENLQSGMSQELVTNVTAKGRIFVRPLTHSISFADAKPKRVLHMCKRLSGGNHSIINRGIFLFFWKVRFDNRIFRWQECTAYSSN